MPLYDFSGMSSTAPMPFFETKVLVTTRLLRGSAMVSRLSSSTVDYDEDWNVIQAYRLRNPIQRQRFTKLARDAAR